MNNISNFILKIKEKLVEKFSDLYLMIYAFFNKENIGKMNEIVNQNINKLNNSLNSIIHNPNSVNIINQKVEIINEIAKKIQFEKYLSNYLDRIFPQIKEEKSKYINVLIIGESGIGKSTLINCFLNINKAKEGIGEAITQKLGESYISESDQNKDFKLFDSYGFSKDEDFSKTIDNIINFIEQRSSGKDLIHCIWYCVNGKRYSNKDKDAIKKLLNKYKDDYLPVIIVNLQTLNKEESNEYFNKLKEFLGDDSKKINFIPILARNFKIDIGKEKKTITNFGLFELRLITKEKIAKAGKSYYYQNIRTYINHDYNYQILNKYFKIKGNIEKMIKNSKDQSMLYFDVEKYFLRCIHFLSFNAEDKIIFDSSLHTIYRQYIDDVNVSYIEEFNNQIYIILEDIIKNCFPTINETFKDKNDIYEELLHELRIYIFNEEKNKETEEDNIFDTIKDLKNHEIINYSNLAKEVLIDDNNKEKDIFENFDKGKIINEFKFDKNEKLNQTENTVYKIDKKDVSKLRKMEYELYRKILVFFSLEIINYINTYLKSEGYNKLNQLIDFKIKELKDSFLLYTINVKKKK